MSNTALGAALTIDDSVLAKIQEAENKIIRLEQTTRTSADKIAKSFRSAGDVGIQYFIDKLKLAQNELNKISVPKIDFGQSINFGQVSQQATLLAESVAKASVAINQYYSSTQKSNRKTTISTEEERKAYIQKYEMYKKMFDQIERNEKRAIKAAENEAKAQEQAAQRIIAAARRQYAEQAKLYQQQNLKQNTTYQGALSFAESANTINRRTKAIQYLTQARAQLSSTDANYAQKLNALNAAIKRMNAENERAVQGARNLAQQHSNLMNTSDQLARKLALIFSVSQIQGYVNKLIQVRGEFELQNTALASILQNKDQADRLFAQITDLAIQSPFTIKELTTYTKSLSAYSVEYEKLYDTTKMLADVSAGLGVDMQRLILAFGQVKAANFLRGTETRQFTEAGINMLGELAKYYSELEGRIVSVGEVQDRQFKRMISFQDVEQVFKRLTSAGGMFYQMQERQAETLSGMMSNLTDRIDIMLNTIGKENEGAIKGTIKVVQSLVSNYDAIVNTIKAAVAAFGAYKVAVLLSKKSLIEFAAANGIVSSAGVKQLTILQLLDVGFKKLSISLKAVAASFKSLFVSNPWLLALTAIATALYEVITWNDEYNEQLDAINKKHNENAASLNKIAEAYEKISEKAKQAAKDQTNFAYGEEDFKSLFAQLQKLDEQLKDRGYNLPIRIELVTPHNIDEAFKGGTEIFRMANEFGAEFNTALASGMNATEGWFNIFGDNLGTDLKDLSDAYSEIGGAFKANLDVVENEVIAASDKLVGSAKEYYEELRKGKKENETELEWTLRRVDLLDKINTLTKQTTTDLYTGGKVYQSILSSENTLIGLKRKSEAITKAEKEAQYELNKVLDELIDKYGGIENLKKAYNDNPMIIKTEIDRAFEKLELNAQAKRFASFWSAQRLQIPLEFETRAEMPTFFNDFRDTVKTLDTKGIFTKQLEGLTSLTDLEQLLQKTYKDVMKDQDVLNRANTKQLDLSKQIAEQKERLLSANKDERDAAQVTLNNLEKQKDVIDKTITSTNGKNKETIAIIKAIAAAFNLMYQSQSKSGTGTDNTSQVFKQRLEFFERANKEYEKLLQNYSKEEARAKVISSMMDEAQQRGVGGIFMSAQFDEKGTLDSLNKVKAMYTKLSEEMRIAFAKAFGGIQLDMDIEVRQDRVKAIQDQFSNLFGNYELSLELDKLGLDKDLMSQLFGVEVFDLSQLRKVLEPFKNELQNTLGKEGVSAWDEMNKKISEAEEKELQDRLKTYAKYLKKSISARAQAEIESQKEIAKIQKTEGLSYETKNALIKQQREETVKIKAKLEWEDFKSSDVYVKLFDDLEYVSNAALNRLKQNLDMAKESMGELEPEQLKAIQEAYNKIEEQVITRNPFAAMRDAMKEVNELQKQGLTEDVLQQNLLMYDAQAKSLKTQITDIETIIGLKQNGISLDTQDQSFLDRNSQYLDQSVETLRQMVTLKKSALSGVNTNIGITNKDLESYERARMSLNAMSAQVDTIRSLGQNAFGSIKSILESVGVEADSTAMIFADMGMSMVDLIAQAVMFGLQLQTLTIAAEMLGVAMNTALGPIGWAVMALQAITMGITAIFQVHDNKRQAIIDAEQDKIDQLQRSYNELTRTIEKGVSLLEYTENADLTQNLQDQIKSYKAMIAAEKDKKKSDENKIKQWEDDIIDLINQIADTYDSLRENLVGNFKSLSEELGDAIVSAFEEGEDAAAKWGENVNDIIKDILQNILIQKVLEPQLQTAVEDYFDALMPKTSAAENAHKRVEKLQKEYDEINNRQVSRSRDYSKKSQDLQKAKSELNAAIAEWEKLNAAAAGEIPKITEGATNRFAQDITNAGNSFQQILENLPDDLRKYFEGESTDTMTGLSKSISGITEDQADALAAITESIRFFTADSNAKLTSILAALTAPAPENPFLLELKAQTEQLRTMNSLWSRIVKSENGSIALNVRIK